jgi:hypothetical protein
MARRNRRVGRLPRNTLYSFASAVFLSPAQLTGAAFAVLPVMASVDGVVLAYEPTTESPDEDGLLCPAEDVAEAMA